MEFHCRLLFTLFTTLAQEIMEVTSISTRYVLIKDNHNYFQKISDPGIGRAMPIKMYKRCCVSHSLLCKAC